jgi:hypothetical protein
MTIEIFKKSNRELVMTITFLSPRDLDEVLASYIFDEPVDVFVDGTLKPHAATKVKE